MKKTEKDEVQKSGVASKAKKTRKYVKKDETNKEINATLPEIADSPLAKKETRRVAKKAKTVNKFE